MKSNLSGIGFLISLAACAFSPGEGVVLTQTAVTLAGASLHGRLLAQTAVTIDGSTVVAPVL